MLLILISLSFISNIGQEILPVWSKTPPVETLPVEHQDFWVEFFPDTPYHIGDILSVRISYTGEENIGNSEIQIALADQPDEVLAATTFSPGNQQATFYWLLDTSNLQPGFLSFIFKIPDMDQTWQKGLTLLSSPPGRPGEWASVHSGCCIIHYVPGSDVENDLAQILKILEEQVSAAREQFSPVLDPAQDPLSEPLSLVLIPIVVGHGGFATDTAVITYSQRNWAGIDLEYLAHHEIVHVLDRKLNPGPRPSLFSEGIAVYLTGGHYRQGDALLRVAALLESGLYVPLSDITDTFYAAQHEIGYMEAAGFVAYLSEILGWERFLEFYFSFPDGDSDSEIIETALISQFGKDFVQIEQDFLAYVSTLTPEDEDKEDVQLTIETYNQIRRYQAMMIPGAHFQTAWWPPIDQVLDEDIPGDYAFREKSPVNIIIENQFLEIHTHLDLQEYEQAAEKLDKIVTHLDRIEANNTSHSHYDIGWPLPGISRTPFSP